MGVARGTPARALEPGDDALGHRRCAAPTPSGVSCRRRHAGEADAPDGAAVAVGRLPVEAAALEVRDLGGRAPATSAAHSP